MVTSASRRCLPHAPSIEDVARLAGVSAQTVSRVSRQAPNVRPETRRRVLEAMDQLGYAPNRAARALRSGTFRTIGVITQQLGRTGETLITAGIASRAEARGYSLALFQVSHPETDDLQRASVHLGHQSLDGLIIVQAGGADPGSLSIPRSLPVVVSDSRLIDDFSSVIPGQQEGAHRLVEHLLSLGHRCIAHVAGPENSRSAFLRAETYKNALSASGMTIGPVIEGDWTARSGYAAGVRIADDHPEVTALFCANDEMAIGTIRALQERGLRVPDQISVVGFDGIELSEFCYPPLTTFVVDFKEIGASLVDLLLSRIGSPQGSLERRTVPGELLVRSSTAPASH